MKMGGFILALVLVVCMYEASALGSQCGSKTWTHTIHGYHGTQSVLQVKPDCTYSIWVGGIKWLDSAPFWVHLNNRVYSSADGSLKCSEPFTVNGTHNVGDFTAQVIPCLAGTVTVQFSFSTLIRSPYSAFIFGQRFPEGASATSTGDKNGILSALPSFKISSSETELGYLAYGGIMVGDTHKKLGLWKSDKFDIVDGLDGGPMALFNQSGQTFFISPLAEPMAASPKHDKNTNTYSWGIMGAVKSIPAGFEQYTAMYFDDGGIRNCIRRWGDMMRQFYNKDESYRNSDYTLNYLSYWTDNGAYYANYYVKDWLIQNMTYEEALLKTKQYSLENNIPYRSIQYSVWFKQGKGGGNALWESNPKLLPDGVRYMLNKTGWEATAHSRWWSPDTPYAKKNGGKYNFIVEATKAIPDDAQFWFDFFEQSAKLGFRCYMQDWLNAEFSDLEATTSDVALGRRWLMQMGRGAQQHGITIQYCMAQSRHVLQSLEVPVVNQARASDDYQSRPDQWTIGISSMFADAVGIAPFKDTLWTTTSQPGNIYKVKEPYPALQVAVATLSTGPVGPGDMVGGTDRALLMKCCSSDGLILKPTKPAMAIDAQIMHSAFGGSVGVGGEVWTTYSRVSDRLFGIVLAAGVTNTYKLTPRAASFYWMSHPGPETRIFSVKNNVPSMPSIFRETSPVELNAACSLENFCMYYTTPLLKFRNQDLLLLGETDKWVPISPQRVTDIVVGTFDVKLWLNGGAGESVSFYYMLDSKMAYFTCTITQAGTNIFSFAKMACIY